MKLEDFINKESGRVSSTKTTEKYVKKHYPKEYEDIVTSINNIGAKIDRFSESLYYYFFNIKEPIFCQNCQKNKTLFRGLDKGYLPYCSLKCSNSSDQVQKLKENSYMEKYGVKNPSQSKEVVDKIQDTFNEKYGGNPFSVMSENIRETNLKKYGDRNILGKNSSVRKKIDNDLLEKAMEIYKDIDIIRYDVNDHGSVIVKCKDCQNEFPVTKFNLYNRTRKTNRCKENPLCTFCNPIGSKTNTGIENFIMKILDDSNFAYNKNNRKILGGKEIDFYLPEKNVGIETNGLYWHSHIYKSNSYHLEKTQSCENIGIKLLHIFEDEIIYKPELVEDRIKSSLGLYDKKIFARKCKIKEIDSKTSNSFLEENHLQGGCSSSYKLGLFYNNSLVSVMTFGSLRKSLGSKSLDGSWELIRFASLKGHQIIGGASKLLSHFIKNKFPQNLISYCDRRWSDGTFYEKIGFKLDSKTKPNYFYVPNNGSVRENRYKYRKDVLVSDGYDPNLTEFQIMQERGFVRIYDCGNYKFVMTF